MSELHLAPGDGVYFEHHTLLWTEDSVNLAVLPLKGMLKRMLAGMPILVTTAEGPGREA